MNMLVNISWKPFQHFSFLNSIAFKEFSKNFNLSLLLVSYRTQRDRKIIHKRLGSTIQKFLCDIRLVFVFVLKVISSMYYC